MKEIKLQELSLMEDTVVPGLSVLPDTLINPGLLTGCGCCCGCCCGVAIPDFTKNIIITPKY